jgi:hypothetical protein
VTLESLSETFMYHYDIDAHQQLLMLAVVTEVNDFWHTILAESTYSITKRL